MRNGNWFVGLAALALTAGGGRAADDLRVLPEKIDGRAPSDMMKYYLLGQVEQAGARWRATYEGLKTAEQIAAYQKGLQGKFVEAIGGFPERTPLNARVTGVVERDGYKVEKIIFESQPKLFVTALLFLPAPEQFKPPYPGVLVPCGHSANGKEHDTYQSMGASLALNGMVALVFDPIDQGERYQLLDENGKPRIGGTNGHTMVGVGCILLGRNTARYEIWDGMRGIDYLQSRPEVDPKRIGCTGNSGGGTQTSYLMALDDRIVVAAPSCYITNFPTLIRTIGPQDAEQNICGQLAFGMDQPDYLIMRAAKPTLICAATKDFFDIGGTWETFRFAKRIYSRMGFAERVDLLENDAGHNYNELQREAVLRWMARWLLKKDEPLTERPIKLLSTAEVHCTPRGQVMLMEGARTVYDLNEDYEKGLANQRRSAWAGADRVNLLEQVRQIAGIRKSDQLPKPKVEKAGTAQREGYRIEKLILNPEQGVYLPTLLFVSDKAKAGPVTLYVHERGKAADAGAGGPIERLVQSGQTVLAVDIRGTGETQQSGQKGFGPALGLDWQDVFAAYLLGRSYVGMRAEDILVCARYAAQSASAGEGSGAKPGGVHLVAVGNVGVPALHAAALEPGLFQSVKLGGTLVSWSNVIHSRLTNNQLVNTVHGALRVYDLPDLAATLGGKLTIEQPVDAQGKPAKVD
jgi:dienelactone hydrolase